MVRRNLNDLLSFVTVAREGSFTRAAALLGMTQSALSQAISGLEARLEIRLLTRTTRSMSPTAAGERLLQAIGHRFDEIEAELDELSELRDKPAGTVRITCGDYVLKTTLLPKVASLLHKYPDVKVEFDVNYGFRGIVADRFDAGVRLGDTIDKDMIAVPIGPKLRMAAVAAPDYFAKHLKPTTPEDLTKLSCINLRFPTHGGLYVWEFGHRGKQLNVRVEGQVTLNSTPHIVQAALEGLGIAFFSRRKNSRRTSRKDGSCGCWMTGAHLSRAITSTTPADDSHHRHFRWYSMRCVRRKLAERNAGSACAPVKTRNRWQDLGLADSVEAEGQPQYQTKFARYTSLTRSSDRPASWAAYGCACPSYYGWR